MEVGVRVGRESERRQAARGDVDAELLGELTDQSRLRRFTRIDLAARKFPQPRHGFAGRALSQQYPSVGIDERYRRHEHDGKAPTPSPPRTRGRVRVGAFSFDSWH